MSITMVGSPDEVIDQPESKVEPVDGHRRSESQESNGGIGLLESKEARMTQNKQDINGDEHGLPTVAEDFQSHLPQAAFLSVITRMRSYVDFTQLHQPLIHQNDRQISQNTPVFTSDVGKYLDTISELSKSSTISFTQYGLLGLRSSAESMTDDTSSILNGAMDATNDLVIANMNMPWSAFICGSQGAGKSHTLSCLLENAILKSDEIGQLPNPLAAMVFHYDTYTNATCGQICEAAYLCSSGVPVTVLVSPSNIWAMTQLYTNLPGLPPNVPRPKVLPLYLSESLLDVSTMLKLMAVDPTDDSVPFYMETVMSILREMAMEGKGTGGFSYTEFRARLECVDWMPGQLVPLSLRLQLLDSFLEPSQYTRSTRPAPAKDDIWTFEPGTMTIVDLSDPFVNSNDACALFSICLSLFLEDRGKCGRVVAVDEAHKFLLQSGAAKTLTADLTSVIRQQRHTGTRVIIATQEPTLSPEIMDLANVTFVHRFVSPAWYHVLKKHLAGADKHESMRNKSSLFEQIVALETGEALLFCPTALVGLNDCSHNGFRVQTLGDGYLKVKIRKRVTADGGRSILASDTSASSLIVSVREIPMHYVFKAAVSKTMVKGKSKASQLLGAVSQPIASTNAHKNISRPEDHITNSVVIDSMPPKQAAITLPSSNPKPTAPTWNPPRTRSAAAKQTTTTVVRTDQPARKSLSAITKEQFRTQVSVQMRNNFTSLGWTTRKDIQWDKLAKEVEGALNLEPGCVNRDSQWINRLTTWAEHEQIQCRKKQKSTGESA